MKTLNNFAVQLLICKLLLVCFMTSAANLSVNNLRTDYKINPLGIASEHPRLSWEIVSNDRNVLQSAYQIRASLTKEGLRSEKTLFWNSQKINSDKSVQVEYTGPELKTGQRIYWQVKVWDNHGKTSDWSYDAFFEMGLLNPSDWKAQWIEPDIKENVMSSNPCPYLRKEFTIQKPVRSARLYATAHGLYLLNLNGNRINDELFNPGWTSYNKRLQYQVFDITGQLLSGQNAIGVILGDGWYRGYLAWQGKKNFYGDKLALLLQIIITYTDGTQETILSDKTWKASTGPILKSEIYAGETYDSRLYQEAWDKPGFNDQNWNGVIPMDYDKRVLVATDGSPVRITQTIKPIRKFITPKGEIVFDLGQNMVGWVRFRLKGAVGTKITLDHAEVLDKQGNFYTDNLRAAKAEDQYIFNGKGTETFEPHFTFHGFRYIRVKDYTGDISLNDMEGRVIHSNMTPVGNFDCSDTLVNQLQKNIQWGLRGNFLDVPTDCPQRDERLGWTGDAQVFAPTACFNVDATSFYTKWMKDLAADQKENGSVPWVVPMIIKGGAGTGWSDGYGATGWADAATVIPWTVYQNYGDKRILENQYPSMKAWVDFMKKQAGDKYLFNTGFHFGDWLSFAEYYSYKYNAPDYGYAGATTEKDLIATAYFYYSAGILEKSATILGKEDDAKEMHQLRENIKKTFQHEFVTASGRLTSGTQTAYTLALAFGIMPDSMRESAAKRLSDDVNFFGHLTTGFLGTPLICEALTDNGYPDVAYKLLFNKRYPSWLYPVTMGATTIWERWDGMKPDSTFQDAGMNSFNHYAYGAVGKWLYSRVAGIQTSDEVPGYKKFIIHPYPTQQLSFAKASYHSVYGNIVSKWSFNGGTFRMEVTVPANTSAQIYIPADSKDKIFEGNQPVTQNTSLKTEDVKNGRVLVEAGSGEYVFEVK